MTPDAQIKVTRTSVVTVEFFIDGGSIGILQMTPDQWDNMGAIARLEPTPMLRLLLEAVAP